MFSVSYTSTHADVLYIQPLPLLADQSVAILKPKSLTTKYQHHIRALSVMIFNIIDLQVERNLLEISTPCTYTCTCIHACMCNSL